MNVNIFKKMNKNKKLLFIVLCSSLFIFAGCNSDEASVDDDNQENEVTNTENESENTIHDQNEENEENEQTNGQDKVFHVEFDENIGISEDGETVYIDVQTNLLDGTQMLYSLEHTKNTDQIETETISLRNGQIQEEVDVSDFDNGNINVLIGMTASMQTDELIETYGENGEQLEGDYVFTEEAGNGVYFSVDLPKISPIELSGHGDKATDTFTLATGFVVVDMNYTGDGNFTSRLTDPAGNDNLVANWVGDYDGKTLTFIDGGEYYLEVGANGDWEAKLTQNIPDEIGGTPDTFEGSGYDVVFVEMSAGNKRFHFTHEGESNFIVRLNDDSLIANAVGEYEGSSTENIQDDGIYAINIQADGDWTIEVEDF